MNDGCPALLSIWRTKFHRKPISARYSSRGIDRGMVPDLAIRQNRTNEASIDFCVPLELFPELRSEFFQSLGQHGIEEHRCVSQEISRSQHGEEVRLMLVRHTIGRHLNFRWEVH